MILRIDVMAWKLAFGTENNANRICNGLPKSEQVRTCIITIKS